MSGNCLSPIPRWATSKGLNPVLPIDDGPAFHDQDIPRPTNSGSGTLPRQSPEVSNLTYLVKAKIADARL
jgi:hypothetical protein